MDNKKSPLESGLFLFQIKTSHHLTLSGGSSGTGMGGRPGAFRFPCTALGRTLLGLDLAVVPPPVTSEPAPQLELFTQLPLLQLMANPSGLQPPSGTVLPPLPLIQDSAAATGLPPGIANAAIIKKTKVYFFIDSLPLKNC
jgi:hypothetical protein